MLVDLLAAIPPKLTIMDAVVGMEGNGPNAGTPRRIGAIVVGTDPAAVDAVCSKLIGVEPMNIATTRIAHQRGLGCGDLNGIEVVGAQIDEVIVKDFRLPTGGDMWTRMHPLLKRLARKQLVPAPYISSSRCKNCLDCLKACPVNVISSGKQHPTINLDPCIRCYCCHEVCNHHAIDLKQGWLGRLLRGDKKI
jgi:Pyruvate/2-oxoacid:ferredoxin oxidoreductase delta subunit